MSGMSHYLTPLLVDHTTGKNAYSLPTVYLALCTTTPTASSVGSSLVEPVTGTGQSYDGYLRIAVPPSSWHAASVSGGATTTNSVDILFPQAGITSLGCNATGWALCDSALTSTGNVLWSGAFTTPMTINAGNTPSIPSTDITLNASDNAGGSDYLGESLINHTNGKTSFAMPTQLYLALVTITVTPDLDGSTITEPTAGAAGEWHGYTRQPIPTSSWASAALVLGVGQASTTAIISLAASLSDSTGVTIVGYALCDAPTAGKVLYYSPLSSQVISAGTTSFLGIGAITLRIQ